MKIAVIGCGNMGGAIVKGLYDSGLCSASDLFCADVMPQNLDAMKAIDSGIYVSNINAEVVKLADYVILAVKPWLMNEVLDSIFSVLDLKKHTLISIAAGVELAQIKEKLAGNFTLFRVLPNTAIALRQSMTFVSSLNASADQVSAVLSIFSQLGKAIVIPESQMAAYTSISSCGIAYALRYVRAAVEGSVELGIRPDIAQDVIAQTIMGAASLLLNNKENAEVEVDKVTTPGGWTIKGLNKMEEYGFSNAVIQGIKANTNK
ncbi:MAG: pyrroline-5-carboxylate reductase [Paludibacteraceae bacterium]|jgi:pyrroline-5-carboxylate reductase|nr:pyrroline-5-carboxylate reductase [Paludibacteraceae bacterium]